MATPLDVYLGSLLPCSNSTTCSSLLEETLQNADQERLSPPSLPPDLLGQTEGWTDLGYGAKKGAPDRAGRNAVRRGAGERDKEDRWGGRGVQSLSANQEPSAAPQTLLVTTREPSPSPGP